MTDQQAAQADLPAELDPDRERSWVSQIGRYDRVIFYFAGHGLALDGYDGGPCARKSDYAYLRRNR